MTEARREMAVMLMAKLSRDADDVKLLDEYCAAFNQMRQFIRNLADESRVYLESEE